MLAVVVDVVVGAAVAVDAWLLLLSMFAVAVVAGDVDICCWCCRYVVLLLLRVESVGGFGGVLGNKWVLLKLQSLISDSGNTQPQGSTRSTRSTRRRGRRRKRRRRRTATTTAAATTTRITTTRTTTTATTTTTTVVAAAAAAAKS